MNLLSHGRTAATAIAAALLAGLSLPAGAEDIDEGADTAGYSIAAGGVSPRSVLENWMILPRGDEVGCNLRFLTAPVGPDGQALRFSDLVIGRLHVRHALGGRAEVYAGADVLPKQPSDMAEPPWQGSHLGARLAMGADLAAFARIAAGPMLGDRGGWGGASAGVAARRRIHPAVTLQGGLDTAYTALFFDDEEDRSRSWLAEVGGHLDVMFMTPIQDFGYWFGFAYSLPVGSGPSGVDKGPIVGTIDPQPRIGFEVGASYAAGPRWDVYLAYAVLDRGDADNPATTLPILDGGFDQRQTVFGIIRRFGSDPSPSEYLVR